MKLTTHSKLQNWIFPNMCSCLAFRDKLVKSGRKLESTKSQFIKDREIFTLWVRILTRELANLVPGWISEPWDSLWTLVYSYIPRNYGFGYIDFLWDFISTPIIWFWQKNGNLKKNCHLNLMLNGQICLGTWVTEIILLFQLQKDMFLILVGTSLFRKF